MDFVRILGISAYYHDSAAAPGRRRRIVAAAQEERFTRKKHDAGFPHHAVEYCLARSRHHAGRARPRRLLRQAAPQVRAAARDLPRLRAARLHVVPQGDAAVARATSCSRMATTAPELKRRSRTATGKAKRSSASIHESHAASAFYPSPFEQAAVLTMDGVGEWATTSIGLGDGNDSKVIARSTSRTRSACCIRRSPTTPASRSTPANTRSWASRPTASRSTSKIHQRAPDRHQGRRQPSG